jgi:uncharacterized protein
MYHFKRSCEDVLRQKIQRPFVHILFGARQTGKSTLLRRLMPEDAYSINLANPAESARFAAHPGELIQTCRSMPKRAEPWTVFIDEAQVVPEIFNAVQTLYDGDPERYRFILCGSSARKLRTSGANLLPGRSIQYSLYPLTNPEYQSVEVTGLPVASIMAQGSLIAELRGVNVATPVTGHPESLFPRRSLHERMLYGDLPGIAVLGSDEDRRDLLKTYTSAHLEQEIRRETSLRNWGTFLRFLSFSAGESGGILNLQAISRESGLSAPAIRSHYQLLEDMFLGFMLPAFSGSPRKSVLSSPRFFFFDLGVRNAAAGLELTSDTVMANPGPLFEQWVGIELYKQIAYLGDGKLSYLRTSGGMEVDFIIERYGSIVPIEVKWTENPSFADARHLVSFMKDHQGRARHGYIVCRCPAPLALSDTITALPWWAL